MKGWAVRCTSCNRLFSKITESHLKSHHIKISEYKNPVYARKDINPQISNLLRLLVLLDSNPGYYFHDQDQVSHELIIYNNSCTRIEKLINSICWTQCGDAAECIEKNIYNVTFKKVPLIELFRSDTFSRQLRYHPSFYRKHQKWYYSPYFIHSLIDMPNHIKGRSKRRINNFYKGLGVDGKKRNGSKS